MSKNNNDIPYEYRPLSPWAYFGYNILFAIPLIGIIFLIVFSLDSSNINRRNYARSFWCIYVLAILVILFFVLLASIGIALPKYV